MEVTQRKSRGRFSHGIVYLSILLLGAALGLGLALSVRPERKAKPPIVYQILVFEAPDSTKDFSDYFRHMDELCNPGPASVSQSNNGLPNQFLQAFNEGKRLKALFFTVNSSTAYLNHRYQLDIEGKELGHGIVTEIIFRKNGRVSRQHFSQESKHMRLLVLDQGPPTTYAIVRHMNSTLVVSGPNYQPIRRGLERRKP